jgi:phosphate uptake regulator
VAQESELVTSYLDPIFVARAFERIGDNSGKHSRRLFFGVIELKIFAIRMGQKMDN